MLKEFIDRIVQLSQVQPFQVDGRDYVPRSVAEIRTPLPKPVQLYTLQGLVDFVKSKIDALDHNKLLIHIQNHKTVVLMSAIEKVWQSRAEHAVASFDESGVFRFGHWFDVEQFNIALQALFEHNDDRSKILALVGNIKSECGVQAEDDGVTQRVNRRVGVALSDKAKVPNPVKLAPYRTFAEVPQPESNFVFRVRQDSDGMPECALFEADGGRWKLKAAEAIRHFLQQQTTDISIIL